MPSFNIQSSSKPVSWDSSVSVLLNQKYEFNPSRTSSRQNIWAARDNGENNKQGKSVEFLNEDFLG